MQEREDTSQLFPLDDIEPLELSEEAEEGKAEAAQDETTQQPEETKPAEADEFSSLSPEERKAAVEIYKMMLDPAVSTAFYATLENLQRGVVQQPISQPQQQQEPEENLEELESKIWEKPVDVVSKIVEKKMEGVIQAIVPLLQQNAMAQVERRVEKLKQEIAQTASPEVAEEAARRYINKLATLPIDQQMNPQTQEMLATYVLGELTREGKIAKIRGEGGRRTPLSSGETTERPIRQEEVYVPPAIRELAERMGVPLKRAQEIWKELTTK